jgi:hypothetical protein
MKMSLSEVKNRNNFDSFRIKTKIAISPENRRQGPQSSPSLEESLSSALLDSIRVIPLSADLLFAPVCRPIILAKPLSKEILRLSARRHHRGRTMGPDPGKGTSQLSFQGDPLVPN